jgi:hypothetical protein
MKGQLLLIAWLIIVILFSFLIPPFHIQCFIFNLQRISLNRMPRTILLVHFAFVCIKKITVVLIRNWHEYA